MRLPLALFALGPFALVAACNGSTAASPAGDGGAPLSDSGIAETSSSQGGPDGATPDGCASAGFDASAYALDAAAGSVLIRDAVPPLGGEQLDLRRLRQRRDQPGTEPGVRRTGVHRLLLPRARHLPVWTERDGASPRVRFGVHDGRRGARRRSRGAAVRGPPGVRGRDSGRAAAPTKKASRTTAILTAPVLPACPARKPSRASEPPRTTSPGDTVCPPESSGTEAQPAAFRATHRPHPAPDHPFALTRLVATPAP